jgi:hypothetical protein
MSDENRQGRKPIVKVAVADPLDPTYPFGRDLYKDDCVVYHATWSNYCSSIEKYGMGKGRLAYQQGDIEALFEIGRRFGFTNDSNGLYVNFAFACGEEAGKRQIYLSRNYWYARNQYAARNPGGETVRYALAGIADLERLLTDSGFRESHARRLSDRKRGLNREERDALRQPLANLADARLLDEARGVLAGIAGRLRPLAVGGHPVIYAIKADPRWYDHWASDKQRLAVLAVPHIPVSRIRERADFINGAESMNEDALMPHPVRWALRPYLNYLSNYLSGAGLDSLFDDHFRFLRRTTDPVVRATFREVFGV